MVDDARVFNGFYTSAGGWLQGGAAIYPGQLTVPQELAIFSGNVDN
jgi:hypothetical protein